MRLRWMAMGLLVLASAALAEDGRYQALPLAGADGSRGGGRAFILDTREGHVWIWSENELITTQDGSRRYGAGFIFQGTLRPGSRPGELIELPPR